MSDDLVKRLWLHDCEGVTREAADRIEELEAANKRLNEQMDAIEEMGTESLNALPECLMRLAPALVENEDLKANLADAMVALQFYRSAVTLRIGCEITHAMQEAHSHAESFIAKIKGAQP